MLKLQGGVYEVLPRAIDEASETEVVEGEEEENVREEGVEAGETWGGLLGVAVGAASAVLSVDVAAVMGRKVVFLCLAA